MSVLGVRTMARILKLMMMSSRRIFVSYIPVTCDVNKICDVKHMVDSLILSIRLF